MVINGLVSQPSLANLLLVTDRSYHWNRLQHCLSSPQRRGLSGKVVAILAFSEIFACMRSHPPPPMPAACSTLHFLLIYVAIKYCSSSSSSYWFHKLCIRFQPLVEVRVGCSHRRASDRRRSMQPRELQPVLTCARSVRSSCGFSVIVEGMMRYTVYMIGLTLNLSVYSIDDVCFLHLWIEGWKLFHLEYIPCTSIYICHHLASFSI